MALLTFRLLLIVTATELVCGDHQGRNFWKQNGLRFPSANNEFSSPSIIACGGLCLTTYRDKCFKYAFSLSKKICIISRSDETLGQEIELSSNFDIYGDECSSASPGIESCNMGLHVDSCKGNIISEVKEQVVMKMSSVQELHGTRCGPEKAIDGIHYPPPGGDYQYVAHTQYEMSPWIQVNLGDNYCISMVKIWNRNVNQLVSDRLVNVLVTIAESEDYAGEDIWGTHCNYIPGRPASDVVAIKCEMRMVGRYVRVTLDGATTYLNIYEMEVLGWW